MNKIIVITGPTAVGKTKLSIELAKKYNGEIINADSMQIYQGIDIGTAKITKEEMEDIPHHLFSIKKVEEEYSIYDYQKDCRKYIDKILKRNHTPILVGGTGLYIKSALYDYQLSQNTQKKEYQDQSNEEIYHFLKKKFPEITIDKNNRRRLIRAMNYYEETGNLITSNKTNKLLYDCIFIGLTCPREVLYQRINQRVDVMIKQGLLKEVEQYHKKNIRTKPLLNGIGYREIYHYLDRDVSLSQAIEEIKKNSRHYAKRQYTFLNHQLPMNWFTVNFDNFTSTIEQIESFINHQITKS